MMMANAIRTLAIDAVESANSGHPGLPLGVADIATVLFSKFLKIDPQHPEWPDRDRFVLSAGHGSMLQYALHYLLGYEDMTIEEIKNFRQLGSRTAGHPEYGHAAGIEATTGPLGQGFANAVGMALSERMLNARFGDDLVDHFTYVIASDGDLMEGINHESISFAGHLKLSKLIVLFDDNGISIDGKLELSESGDVLQRYKAANWHVIAVDGHNPEAIEKAILKSQESQKPSLIACKTIIGYGSPNKQGKSSAHGAPLGKEETKLTKAEYKWKSAPFEIPSDILDAWRMVGLRHISAHKAWKKRLEAQESKIKNRFKRLFAKTLPATFEETIQNYKQELSTQAPNIATRKSSENALNIITGCISEMIGGSADLTGSNNTKATHQRPIQANQYDGDFIHYGIREHAMAAIMNGIALHGGFIPYSGTFLVFSDYARPAIRLSALMKQRVIHVLTHDSIGLGEDGPTHQPVEHLASLRAIPNLLTMRPADAVETLECWQIAIKATDTPSAIALTRQALPAIRTEYTNKNLCMRGAYEIASADAKELVTLLASGSELHLILEAKETLEKQGIGTKIISVPCFELFDQQEESYKADILGNTKIRIAVEAAIRQGWDAYLRPQDGFIGMNGFGASAPAEQLFRHFNITHDAIVKTAHDLLEKCD